MNHKRPSVLSAASKLRRAAAQAALKDEPDSYGTWLGMANTIASDDPIEAVPFYDRALEIRPDATAALHGKLGACARLNDQAECDRLLDMLGHSDARPYWVDRWLEGRKHGVFVFPSGVRLPYAAEFVAPWIARYMATGSYEAQEAALLEASLSPGDRLLELGAGLGFIGATAKILHPGVTYLGFEANPSIFPFIERTCRLNEIELDIRNAVLGTDSGTVSFHEDRRFWRSAIAPTPEIVATHEVRLERFTEIMREFRPTFLVCDIEGGEYDLLPLEGWRGVRKILVEMHPDRVSAETHRDGLMRLLSLGFIPDANASMGRVMLLRRER